MEGKIKSTKKQSRNALREKISWIKKTKSNCTLFTISTSLYMYTESQKFLKDKKMKILTKRNNVYSF